MLFLLATPMAGASRAQGSSPMSLTLANPDFPSDKNFHIRTPGLYQLTKDEIQEKLWGGGHVGPKGGFMVNIQCGSVALDLGGHILGADFGIAGVLLSARNNREFANRFPKILGDASLDNRFVTVRNGTIDLARGEGTLVAVEFAEQWHDTQWRTTARAANVTTPYYRRVPEGVTYTRNDYRFEQLKVLAKSIALSVEGSHTVIRDCVIESAGVAAIFIAGPNVVIENCEIRLRPLAKDAQEGTSNPMRAAIFLRDASGAVIRNNRIRVDEGGEPSQTHCIVVRDGASDVVIEGNTFINVKGEPVTLLDGSAAA
jgi:hypothetical protein